MAKIKKGLALLLALVMCLSMMNLTALAASSSSGREAYFYIWKPDHDYDTEYDANKYKETWYYAGKGSVVDLNAPGSYQAGEKIALGNHLGTVPTNLPDITYQNVNYKYQKNGGPGTYDVEWQYIVSSNGANNNNDGNNETLVGGGTRVFHVDGRVVFKPNLTITKEVVNEDAEVDNADAKVGDTLKYTITVTNNGSGAAQNVIVEDDFSGTGSLVWEGENPSTRFSLPSGSTKTFTATYKVQNDDEGKTLTNTATV